MKQSDHAYSTSYNRLVTVTEFDQQIIAVLPKTNTVYWLSRAYINLLSALLPTFLSFTHHTVVFPQTRAIALFQPNTANGKLNADITPTTPRGFHISSSVWSFPEMNSKIVTAQLISWRSCVYIPLDIKQDHFTDVIPN